MPDDKPINPLLRDLIVGFGRIGVRAVASGAKSVAKDVDSILGEGRGRLRKFVEGMEEMVGGSGERDGDDDSDGGKR